MSFFVISCTKRFLKGLVSYRDYQNFQKIKFLCLWGCNSTKIPQGNSKGSQIRRNDKEAFWRAAARRYVRIRFEKPDPDPLRT